MWNRVYTVENEQHEAFGKFVCYLYRDCINWDKAKALGLRCIMIDIYRGEI